MKTLTGKQTRFLRSIGHSLKPVLQVGKEGVSEAFLEQLARALEVHELIKVKVLQNAPMGAKDAATTIAEKQLCHIAQIIGKTLLLYQAREEKPEIVLPE